MPVLAVALLSVAATAAIIAARPSAPDLLVVSMPVEDNEKRLVAGLPLVAGAAGDEEGGAHVTRYAPQEWPSGPFSRWDLVHFSAPAQGLPLAALGVEPGLRGPDCRFSELPVVTATEEGFALASEGPVTGWVIHAER